MAWVARDTLEDIVKVEEGSDVALDFTRIHSKSGAGVVPVAVQDADTREILLIAHVNEDALRHSIQHHIATFWSMTRDELWIKGLSSGNSLELIEILVNCEQNSLVFKVRPNHGGACHTREGEGYRRGCYYRRINGPALEMLEGFKPNTAQTAN